MASDLGVRFYREAKERLLSAGFAAEIERQVQQEFTSFTETDLLREAAWVILCSGFRESIIRRCFDFVSLCFCDWESASAICDSAELCRATSLSAFGNRQKIDAIVRVAEIVTRTGFVPLKEKILLNPIHSMQALPFIGPITAFHLAKNLGYPTAKPDRHLVRLAEALGYPDAYQLCSSVSQSTGDSVQMVDTVLWRHAERYGALEKPELTKHGSNQSLLPML